jgi:hypothetical membrane protein
MIITILIGIFLEYRNYHPEDIVMICLFSFFMEMTSYAVLRDLLRVVF